MKTDIQSRGFTLTPALGASVAAHAAHYRSHFPKLNVSLAIRLFDVNGSRGGLDKCCLVQANLGRQGIQLVTNSIDSDLYLAIANAFAKLSRSTAAYSRRERSRSRWQRTLPAWQEPATPA